MDEQIKLHGYRIELGEIQTSLSSHSSIAQAIVMAQEGSAGKQLVAYIVGKAQQTCPSDAELCKFLADRLPPHMIPGQFVFLNSFPLTPNGKIDRNALTFVRTTEPVRNLLPPQTEIEKQLAEIWSSVLKVGIGRDDNFFKMGGDSILCIQVAARAKRYGLQLAPKDIFDHQTVRALAVVVKNSTATSEAEYEISGPVPLLPIQQWFFEQNFPNPHHWNQSLLLRVNREVNAQYLKLAVTALLGRHAALRLRFESGPDKKWTQIPAPGNVEQDVFTEFDLREMASYDQGAAAEQIANQLQASLNLGRGPLMRVALLRFGGGADAHLLLIAHHLIVDGVSWRVLLEDLEQAYEQTCQLKAVNLGPGTASLHKWVTGLLAEESPLRSDKEIAYWHAVAENSRKTQGLPVDCSTALNTAATVEWLHQQYDAEETEQLVHQPGIRWRASLNEVLLTALLRALARWSEADRQLIEIEGHGRNEDVASVDVTRTVGWFTAPYPVVFQLGGSAGVKDHLADVKDELRRVPHGGVGYGVLRYHGPHSMQQELRSVQPEVTFNYFGQLRSGDSGSGLVLGEAAENSGMTQSGDCIRRQKLVVTLAIIDRTLKVSWAYSRELHKRQTIEQLATWFRESLSELLRSGVESDESAYVPADFPYASLQRPILEALTRSVKDIEDIYALSPMQQGMLFHLLYDGSSPLYILQLSCTFRADLDIAAFQRAWREVIQRHPILRTAFLWKDFPEPLQVVVKHVPVPIQVLDWRLIEPDQQKIDYENYLAQDGIKHFNPSQPPLMRLSLIRLSDHDYRFVWSSHHILFDGWSRALLMKEVMVLYEAYKGNEESDLPPSVPYRDYIAWLHARKLPNAESFWKQVLAGTECSRLPGQSEARSGVPYLFARQHTFCPASLTHALQTFAREQQITVSTAVQGMWALLLSHFNSAERVRFGATVAGRPSEVPGIEQMVGLFINILPVSVAVRDEDLTGVWLRDLQREQGRARDYECCPLSNIQKWTETPPGEQLFESVVVFENYPVDEVVRNQNVSLGIADVRYTSRESYPFVLFAEMGTEMFLRINYDGRRFEESYIKTVFDQIQLVLQRFVTFPDAALKDHKQALAEAEKRCNLAVEQRLETARLEKFSKLQAKKSTGN